jgi:glycosyltransferase involved in cell wall biosynthesis
MRVLMISLDRNLLKADSIGDVVERHKEYAQYIDKLDIIIFSKKGFAERKINAKLNVYPTNSLFKIFYAWDAYKVARPLVRPNTLIICQDPFLTGLAGWFLKRKFKIPLLIHFHGDFWQNPYWLQERWYNLVLLLLSKFLVKKADGIRVVSFGIKQKLIKAGLLENKIRVIPTPTINLEKFQNYDLGEVNEIKEQYHSRKIILYVGRLVKEKNLPLLFRAVKKIISDYPQCVFLIIGQGKEEKKLKLQVLNYSLKDYIKFLGPLKHEDLVNYYQACYALVLPSFSESFGKVLLEAGLTQKPTVATATTGAKEIIIDSQTGFLAPINNQTALARAIIKLLQDENLAQEMGQKAKEHILANFNPEQIIQKMIRFWKELTSSS